MSKIRVIDLLNKIANGEEVPKRIIYDEYVYKLSEDRENYENEIDPLTTLDWNYIAMNCLNEEVEILNKSLKEEKKIPEKLDMVLLGQGNNWTQKFNMKTKEMETTGIELNPYIIEIITTNTLEMQNKLNQLIDYLKSKGDE